MKHRSVTQAIEEVAADDSDGEPPEITGEEAIAALKELRKVPVPLAQKLIDIGVALEPLKATGQDQYKNLAFSIEDIENAIAKELAARRVLVMVSHNAPPVRDGNLWLVDITVGFYSPETDEYWPTGQRGFRASDIGSNPSAAESFALKRFYKATWHIADETDQGSVTPDEATEATVEREARRDTPRAAAATKTAPAGIPGFDTDHYAELLAMAKQLPDGVFVPSSDFAERKLVARLKHHASEGGPENAYMAMKAELAALQP